MKLGDRLAQEFKPLANQIRLLDRDSRHIAGRVLQALNQTAANPIERNVKDDRNGCCRLFQGSNRASIRNDDINVLPQEFSGDFANAFRASHRPTVLGRDGLTFNPTQFPQAVDKGGYPWTPNGRIRAKNSDTPWLPYLLRVRAKWPRDNTATKTSNELPSLHELHPARATPAA